MFGTYQRLMVRVSATPREVVKAARGRLKPSCWHDPMYREARKAFYREMLGYHAQARAIVREWGL
jgi:hypothetical protein